MSCAPIFQSSCTNSAQSFENVSIGMSPRVLRCSTHVVRQPEQEVGERIAGRPACEVVLPFRIVGAGRVAVLGVVARVDAAELHRVRAFQPRRAAAQREGGLPEIAEGVLPLVLDAGWTVRCGELELWETGRQRRERRHLDPERGPDIAGDEPALPVALVQAVAAAELVDDRAGPDPRPPGGQRDRLGLPVQQAEVREPGAAVARRCSRT